MTKHQTLLDVLIEEIKDLYSAETQLQRALPRLVRAAGDRAFKSALTQHLSQTKGHAARLEEVADLLGIAPTGRTCQAMQGLIAEADERLDRHSSGGTRDASLIGVASKMTHYEIAGYGSARTLAQVLGHHKVAELLQSTLDEQCAEDHNLTGLADLVYSRVDSPHGQFTIVS